MPLPLGGPWPPKPYDIALSAMNTFDAWYVGDTERLATAYAGTSAAVTARPSQFAGGIVGTVARMFWGRPITGTQNRAKLHMPVAADLCSASAKLLFADPPTFGIPSTEGNDAAKARLDRIVNTPRTHSTLVDSAETGAALGGTYLRLVWDTDVADHVMLDAVDADRAIGEFRWGQLVAATFFDELANPDTEGDTRERAFGEKKAVWRHLERHEPGVILHGLYRGTDDKLGTPLPLEEHPATEGYAPLVNDQQAIPTDVKGLTAGYVPNATPNREWRKKPALKALGRPDLAGVETQMDFIDETWSSLARDVRLAKARLLVPQYMLTDLGVGKGAAFDTDQEIFTPLHAAPTEDGKGEITPHQFEIRVDEHLGTINATFREILRTVGYSPLTFGMPDEVATTATEVNAHEKESLSTRRTKIRHWTAALGPLARTMLELDAVVFRTGVRLTEDVELNWPDGAKEALEVRSRSVSLMGDAASLATKVRIIQPDLDNDAVDEEVDRIRAEQGMTVDDPANVRPAGS